jgi:hypothetical protein
MARRFTLDQAESLLPDIEKSISEAVSSKTSFEEAESALQAITQRVMMLGGVLVDRNVVQDNKTRRDNSAERLKTAIEKLQEMGCVIKDLDVGLVDFPTLFRGEEVYLCWKLGESGIRFWHGTNEGFAGRKPIDDDFLEHHRGDAAN